MASAVLISFTPICSFFIVFSMVVRWRMEDSREDIEWSRSEIQVAMVEAWCDTLAVMMSKRRMLGAGVEMAFELRESLELYRIVFSFPCFC